MRFKFTIEGTAFDGQSWTTTGTVSVEGQGEFSYVLEEAQRNSFMQLTRGKAIYGKPGVGCRGPYQIKSFTVVEEATQP